MICPECNGKREIALFTSVVKCERCSGLGQVGEHRVHRAVTSRASSADPEFTPENWQQEPEQVFDVDSLPVGYVPRVQVIDPRRPNVQNLRKAEKNDLYKTLYGGGRPMKFGFIQEDGSISDQVPLLPHDYSLPMHLFRKYRDNLKRMNEGK